MSFTPSIALYNIHFTHPGQKTPLFSGLTLTFSTEKIGIVGRNGSGKSTLLNLITQQCQPQTGQVQVQGRIGLLAQQARPEPQTSVAQLLGIADKLHALARIAQGSVAEKDFEIVGDDWQIAQRTQTLLSEHGLAQLSLHQVAENLSGGELVRLQFIRLLIQSPDFILLDEPTNHLDTCARNTLYDMVNAFTGGVIIASHDRQLLRQVNKIIELNSLGHKVYGGNFDAYQAQKTIELEATEKQLKSDSKHLSNAKQAVTERLDRHQRLEAKGRREKHRQVKGKMTVDKIGLNTKKGRSEKTNQRIRTQAQNQLEKLEENLQASQQKIENLKALRIPCPKIELPEHKKIIECTHVEFTYPNSSLRLQPFSLSITGPERIALQGPNGSGKTTLAKLIVGALEPTAGRIQRNIDRIRYLDQHSMALAPDKTVLENFRRFNPKLSEFESRSQLAHFLFRNVMADRLAKTLSGGEKIRAILACILMSQSPPQMLVLDEPSNHLDLQSIEILQAALSQYQGALLVISHDPDFLKHIGIQRRLQAGTDFALLS